MKINFFIIIFFVFGLTQKSFAYSSDPKQFIQEVVDEAKKVLVETNSKEIKTIKLSEIALRTAAIQNNLFPKQLMKQKKCSQKQIQKNLKQKNYLKWL